MKYKILLADDEQIFLQYMKECIDWKTNDCEIVALARDGREALAAIEVYEPDIIFIDINMPNLTGLEVCEKLNEKDLMSKIVIMTAHDEFDFVHKAMKLSVIDYLLKPFGEAEVKKSLEKCKKEILNQRELTDLKRKNLLTERKRKFKNILAESCNDEISDFSKESSFTISIVRVLNSVDEEILQNDLDIYLDLLDSKSYVIDNVDEVFYIVLHALKAENITIDGMKIAYEKFLKHNSEKYTKVVISEIYSEIKDTRKIYKKALSIMEMCFRINERVILTSNYNYSNNEHCKYSKQDLELLILAFLNKSEDDIKNEVKKIFHLSKEESIAYNYLTSIYQSIVLDFFAHYNKSIDELPINLIDAEELLVNFRKLQKPEEIELFIIKRLNSIFKLCEKSKNCSKKERLVEEIEKYLLTHYSNRYLTTKDIADAMFFESSYIRRIYKEKTNKTIANRLEEIRIEHAKELLKLKSYTNSDIAKMVGYSDQSYFSKRFKKHIGVTPTKYLEID